MIGLSPIKILLVDDTPSNIIYFKKILKKLPVHIDSYQDARKGLEAAKNTDYHLLLLDVQMPVLNGIEFCQAYRQNTNAQTPVLMITAHNVDSELITELYKAGASDLILKPIHPDVLYNKIRFFLDSSVYLRELRAERQGNQELNTMLMMQAEEISNLKNIVNAQQLPNKADKPDFENFFQMIDMAAIILDVDFTIININNKMNRILGYSQKELLNKEVFLLFQPDKKEKIKEIFQQQIIGNNSANLVQLIGQNAIQKPYYVRISEGYRNGKNCYHLLIYEQEAPKRGAQSIRKSAEHALQLAEEKFRLAFSINPAYMMIYDLNTHIIWDVNEAFVLGMEYPKSELIGRDIKSTNILQKHLKFNALLLRLEQGEYIHGENIHLNSKSGRSIYGRLYGRVMTIEEYRLVVFVIADITQQKIAENELREKREQLQFALENSLQGVWDWNINSDIISLNKSALEFIGINKKISGLSSHSWFERIVEEDRKKVMDAFLNHKNGISDKIEVSFRVLKGEDIRWLVCRGKRTYNHNDKIDERIIGIIADISLQKQAEEATQEYQTTLQFLVNERTKKLAKSEKKLRNIFDHVQDVYFEMDFNGKILEVTPSVSYYKPSERKTIIGRNAKSFFYDEADYKLFLEILNKQKQIIDYEIDLKTAQGSIIHFSITARQIEDAENQESKIIGSLRDISRRKQAENSLHELNRNLGQEVNQRTRELVKSQRAITELYTNLSIGLYRVSPKGDILMANPYLIQLMGYENLEELKKLNIPSSYATPGKKKEFDEIMEAEGEIHGFEAQWITKNGNILMLRENARAVYSDKGNLKYYEGSVEDISERQLIYDKLQKNEELLRAVFDGMQSGLSLLDNNLRPVKTNKWMNQYFGSNIDANNISCHKYFHNKNDVCEACPAVKTLKDGRKRSSIIKFKTKQNESKWFEVSTYPVKDKNSNVTGLIEDMRDVTPRIQAEQFLKYKEKFHELIIEQAGLYVNSSYRDIDKYHKSTLKRAGEYAGVELAELFFFDHIQPDYLSKIAWQKNTEGFTTAILQKPDSCYAEIKSFKEGVIRQISKNEIPTILEKFDSPNPGNLESMICLPLFFSNELKGFMMFCASGNTKNWEEQNIPMFKILAQIISNAEGSKRSSHALKYAEQRYKILFENAPVGVFQSDEHGEVISMNEEAAKLGGFKSIEHAQKENASLVDFYFHKHERGSIWNELIEKGSIKNREIKIKRYDNKGSWASINLKLSFNAEKKINIVDGFVVDVTEQKKAISKMKEALEKLQELNRLKTNFVSMVSHELRTPLAGISSSTEIINHYIEELTEGKQEKARKHTNQIRSEINRLLLMMEDVLQIGKQSAGKNKINPELFDLESFVQIINDRYFSSMQDGRQLQISVLGTARKIYSDKNLLIQTLNNLISNAFKYSDGKKRPELLIDYRDSKQISLSVRDYGVGIPKEEQTKIFDLFFRASNVSNISGTGLGMHIVQQNIQQLGGSIKLDSKNNEGSCFTVCLPDSL